jgi:alpha-amylase
VSQRAEAITHLLRSQANDAYWHGIFGGLYAPHLRTALWRELVRAETLADSLNHGGKPYQAVTQLDFDADGMQEIEITSPRFAVVVKPSDGGTLAILDFRRSAVTLINSLQRRVEAYHSKLQNAAQFTAKVASIHDQSISKEPGLEKRLKYDRWARNTFRLLLFAPGKTHADFEALRLEESASFAGGNYRVDKATEEEIQLGAEAPLRQILSHVDGNCVLRATKVLKFENREKGFDVRCRIELAPKGSAPASPEAGGPAQFTVGLEIVINLLAPNIPDRYIEFAGDRKPLEWSGVVEGPKARFVDEWQDVAVDIEACGASKLWISPIETVSESEEGFERVYQGSQILGVWNVTLDPEKPWSVETVLHVTTARGA